ncbi:hypothetical protein G6F65_015495 [Rhizopus arrhizus]|nr:hypothetical protein G6F65_015495 [Rhizopus arrhizus]
MIAASTRAAAETLAEHHPPLQPDHADAQRQHHQGDHDAQPQRLEAERFAGHLGAGVEEIERHEERGEQAQRVQVLVRGQQRHALVQQARDQAGDEGADQVVHAQQIGDVGRDHADHHQQRELRAGRVRCHPASQRDEQQRQADHHCQQGQAGQRHMARITGLQHDEQRRQRQQFAGNGLAGHPEPLVFAQAQPRQRIHDEAGGGRQQRQRQQARGLPRQLRVAPGQPAHAEQRAGADHQVRQQRPHATTQRPQIHFQAGEQEQRRNAQRGQQTNYRVVRLVTQPQHADDAEQQAGQRRWQAEALQRAGDHQQREDQQQDARAGPIRQAIFE